MGTKEGEHPDQMVDDMLAFASVLRRRGWREGDDLAASVIEGAEHSEVYWRRRAEAFLKFLFVPR
jgi:hypothetical protein